MNYTIESRPRAADADLINNKEFLGKQYLKTLCGGIDFFREKKFLLADIIFFSTPWILSLLFSLIQHIILSTLLFSLSIFIFIVMFFCSNWDKKTIKKSILLFLLRVLISVGIAGYYHFSTIISPSSFSLKFGWIIYCLSVHSMWFPFIEPNTYFNYN
jgi:hypothetical protein